MRNAGFDQGTGPPVIVIPGVQGRWEWMRPAVDALAARCRTVSYSLRRADADPPRAIEELAIQLDRVLDRAGLASTAVLGVSFGGLVAAHYAASRPHRTRALIIASAPGPAWRPADDQRRYIRRPWLSAPAFGALAPMRLWPEIVAAISAPGARARFCTMQTARVCAAPAHPPAMAARATLAAEIDLSADCRRVAAPTLVLTGEPALDRVVPVESTREYLALIPGAQYAMMERTGHLGLVTRPDQFAQIVCNFVMQHQARSI
ncbi:MAG: alpha/beta fold hydrolase [Vicinamibacterales bacterium]